MYEVRFGKFQRGARECGEAREDGAAVSQFRDHVGVCNAHACEAFSIRYSSHLLVALNPG